MESNITAVEVVYDVTFTVRIEQGQNGHKYVVKYAAGPSYVPGFDLCCDAEGNEVEKDDDMIERAIEKIETYFPEDWRGSREMIQAAIRTWENERD